MTGEVFSDPQTLEQITRQIKNCYTPKFELVIVLGGGNFFRGRNACPEDKLITDRAGMLGTVINGIVLEHRLRPVAVHLSALDITGLVKHYQPEKALMLLKRHKILVLSGGTGLPYFSTDTATALRACELNADLILKATNVDGVFTADPNKNRHAKHLKTIDYEQAINKDLKIMDGQAFALLKERRIPIIVFNVFKPGNLGKILAGQKIGSIVC